MKKTQHNDMRETTSFDKNWQGIVAKGSLAFGIELSLQQLDLFTGHAEELIKWNKKINMTAIVNPFDVALKHFIDSIAIIPYIPDGSRVIDLGSGGGFPGMPLKVVNPSLDVVMVDASEKKISFINNLIRKTGMTGVKAVHCRAEDLSKQPEYAHKFDFVISRAFTALSGFIEMGLPLIKKKETEQQGTILAMKGELKPDELAPLVDRKDITTEIEEYFLPFENHKRCIVKIRLSNF
ncbi:MAG: 16S rRNA (guanine(527)-N(7))-methyltransferase RsmG [Desulfamplus sp.]|nr:16S rRNA (guanine(527)-N(7))-methyltransferase RsmG [Desulfamplus sp.]